MNRRLEFTAQTKRDAYKRSNGICECHRIPQMVRCGQPLTSGNIFYEHINPDAIRKDNSLDNCAALTKTCWRIKTDRYDRKVIVRNNRARDRAIGARGVHSKIPGGKSDRLKKTFYRGTILRATGERA